MKLSWVNENVSSQFDIASEPELDNNIITCYVGCEAGWLVGWLGW